MLDPAETRSPARTAISHSGPRNTSTREPNLIRPTRSPAVDMIARLFVTHDASRDQPGDLLEDHASLPPTAFDRNGVLLIRGAGLLLYSPPGTCPSDTTHRDASGNRRTIHMNVENIQEDADAVSPPIFGFTATTLPSAGETLPDPGESSRSGSRKKYRQKQPARKKGWQTASSPDTSPPRRRRAARRRSRCRKSPLNFYFRIVDAAEVISRTRAFTSSSFVR